MNAGVQLVVRWVLALALLVVAPGDPTEEGELIAFEIEPGNANLQRPTTGQALDFIRFLASGHTEWMSPGSQLGLRWRRAA